MSLVRFLFSRNRLSVAYVRDNSSRDRTQCPDAHCIRDIHSRMRAGTWRRWTAARSLSTAPATRPCSSACDSDMRFRTWHSGSASPACIPVYCANVDICIPVFTGSAPAGGRTWVRSWRSATCARSGSTRRARCVGASSLGGVREGVGCARICDAAYAPVLHRVWMFAFAVDFTCWERVPRLLYVRALSVIRYVRCPGPTGRNRRGTSGRRLVVWRLRGARRPVDGCD